MKRKLKTNCSIVRIVRLFECGRVVRCAIMAALCAVGLAAFAAETDGVQLWEGGPCWATCNVGADTPEGYGILTNYNDAAQVVTDALGEGWRLPTKAEIEALLANCGKGTWTEQNGAKGRLFTGTGDYSSNSIFLPAAGYVEGPGRKWAEYVGRYWSSGEVDGNLAWYLYFYDSDVFVYNYDRSWGFSVRAVRDAPPEPPAPEGSGTLDNPWKVGGTDGTDDLVEAWTNGTDKLVIEGAGSVTNLADAVKDGITEITIKVGVTGAADGVFAGFNDVSLTLPDGWQGELPDEDGKWYGATDVTLKNVPLTVKNVTFLQRYPWNGKVDVSCDLTGAGEVTLNVTVFTNGVKLCEATALAGETTVDLDAADGVKNGVKFVWDAAADVPVGFKASGVQIKVTAEQ